MPIKTLHNYKIIIYLLVAVLFFYPNNHDLLFDGLILDKFFEIFLILFFIPLFLLINKKKNLYFKKIIFISFCFLIVIKFFLIFLPNQQININTKLLIKNNLNMKNEVEVFNNNNFFIKQNYQSIKKDLLNYKNFPIEWINYINPKNAKYFFLSNPKEMSLNEYQCINQTECNRYIKSKISDYIIQFNINAYILINKNQNFFILANNVIDHNLKLKNKNIELDIKVTDNLKDNITNIKKHLKEGLYKIEGNIKFSGNNLSFTPYLIENNKIFSAFENNSIYDSSNVTFFLKNIIQILSFLFNSILILLLILFSYNLIKNILFIFPIKDFIFTYSVSSFFIIFFIFFNLYNLEFINNENKYYEIFSGSFILSIFLLIMIFINLQYKKKLNKIIEINYLSYLSLFVFLPILTFYFSFWLNDIYQFTIHTKGNDWHTIQYFAYRIGTLGEYLRAGEDIFYFRPLLRYLSFLTNYIFGQNFFSNQFIELWFIILSSLFMMKIIFLNTINIRISIICLLILCFFYFGETFKFLIGRQLSEFPSLLFLLINLYLLNYYGKKNYIQFKNIISILILGILSIYFRENHLPVLLSAIFVYFINQIPNKKVSSFYLIFFYLKKFKFIFLYSVSIIFLFSLIYFRNYYLSGSLFYQNFGLTSDLHPNIKFNIHNSLKSLYVLLTGSLVNEMPRTFSIVNILASIIAIYSLLTKQKKEIKIFGFLVIISIIPYLFLNIHGYRPRYSIQILPYSIIFLSIFWSIIKRKSI